jgi:hypothetical protein
MRKWPRENEFKTGECKNVKKARKAKKSAVTHMSGLHIHPYTVGLSLGRQIRFSAPVEQITAELEKATRKHLG